MPRSTGLMLEITRTLRAARPIVFSSFSQADELARWWGPKGFTTLGLEFDPRVGNEYRIEMQPPEGDPFFLARLASARSTRADQALSSPSPGKTPIPTTSSTMVDSGLRRPPRGRRPRSNSRKGQFKTERAATLHRDGWTESFNRLERMLVAAER